jgi:hypothetical protein
MGRRPSEPAPSRPTGRPRQISIETTFISNVDVVLMHILDLGEIMNAYLSIATFGCNNSGSTLILAVIIIVSNSLSV